MSIVAHHEGGFTIGVFSKKEVTISCEMYLIKANTLLCYNKSTLSYIDLKTIKTIKSYDTSEIKNIGLSECGKFSYAFDFKKNCSIYSDHEHLNTFENVNFASISSTFLCLKKDGNKVHLFELLNFSNRKEIEIFHSVKFYSLIDNFVVLTQVIKTDGDESISIRLYNKKIIAELKLKTVEKTEVKTDGKGNFLLLITKKYSSGAYFGDDHIYFRRAGSDQFLHLEIPQPPLFYVFMNDKFAICYGHQPSSVSFFDFDCKKIKNFEKGPRNKIYFNPHYNLVAFCGFGNLSGNIEIHDCATLKIINKFRVLGATVFNWSPCGSYFCISIISYMKDGNIIKKYDYYGREIEFKEYNKLYSTEWIGDKMEFKVLDPPNELIIEKQALYVPPSYENIDFKEKFKKNPKTKKIIAPVQKPFKPEKPKVTTEYIKKELDEIERIKTKLENNGAMSVKDYNLLLKEDWLLGMLKKNESNK